MKGLKGGRGKSKWVRGVKGRGSEGTEIEVETISMTQRDLTERTSYHAQRNNTH